MNGGDSRCVLRTSTPVSDLHATVALTGLTSAVPASAAAGFGITSSRVSALNPTAGTVALEWVSQTGDRFAVADVSGAAPIVRVAALDAPGWTSHAEAPGTHTYRVTRTPGDGTARARLR